jgi:hypothetical protein
VDEGRGRVGRELEDMADGTTTAPPSDESSVDSSGQADDELEIQLPPSP